MTPLEFGASLVFAGIASKAKSDYPRSGTRHVVRVTWDGGITTVDGTEDLARDYTVRIRTERGPREIRPLALGDLDDSDNNHELCLAHEGRPLTVRMPAGRVLDPGGDVNERTTDAVR